MQRKKFSDLRHNTTKRSIRVFVHLAADKDIDNWAEAWRSGTLVGINDETPYGYSRANHMGCSIIFSKASHEWKSTKILRLALRLIVGFDFLHAFRQRRILLDSDIVWTHTESQYLAVAALVLFTKKRPKILGQSVWLFDRWHSLNLFHKILYRRLIRCVDVLTVHSSKNLTVARVLFPHKRVELVPFGVPSERMTAPVLRSSQIIRVLTIGNDRHRDWQCLAEAVDGLPNASLIILSGSAPHSLMKNRPNLQIIRARTNSQLLDELDKASVVCVPLRPNLHASGITVIQEAVLAGVPVVATATGGLEDYFGPDVVRYVPHSDPKLLREALQSVAADPESAKQRAIRAQIHMRTVNMGAESFVRRHVEISEQLLAYQPQSIRSN